MPSEAWPPARDGTGIAQKSGDSTSPLVEGLLDRFSCTLASTKLRGGDSMDAQTTQQTDHNTVVRNTKRINKLVHEVEMLVRLLEEQRLVEPAALIQVKKELREIQR